MVKRTAGALLHSIDIDQASPRTLTTQISTAIREIILSGGLRAGDRLPATRTLAKELGVSRTTMVEVFERLVSEGLLISTVGAGTFVSGALNDKLHPPESGPQAAHSNTAQTQAESRYRRRLLERYRVSHESTREANTFIERLPHKARAFTTAMPALDKFPISLWARQNSRHWRDQRDVVLGYGDPAGFRPLRRAIAAHLRATHGISCDDEQIFIVNGAQQAFHFIASVLLENGDRAWIENPGAIGARNALLAAGADLVPVDVDRNGLMVEQGVRVAPDFRLAFVTPVHQQPMAVSMSLERRFALLKAAEKAGAWIIEDDYDGEFYYANHRLPSLKSVDRSGRVFYVGSFSKTLFPALRLGYFLAPAAMTEIFQAAVSAYFTGVPANPQAVVTAFMEEGHYATHIRRMRRIYLQRYETLYNCGKQYLAGMLDVEKTDAGLHTVGILSPALRDVEVAAGAEARNITVTPIRRFCLGPSDINGLVLGFSGINGKAIEAGVKTLSRVLEKLAAGTKNAETGSVPADPAFRADRAAQKFSRSSQR